MNKLQQLAYRNLKKYKKHYLFISILIIFLTTIILSYPQIFNNHYYALKQYNQEHYGTWFCKANIQYNEKEFIELEANKYNQMFYCYIYNQGYDNNGYNIGYAQKEIYEFCHLELVEGKYPQNKDQIMISTTMKKEQKLKLHQTIPLTINNKTNQYEIVGFIKNSQEFIFPDIYTNIQYGESLDMFMNQSMTIYYDDGSSVTMGEENKYGYTAALSIESLKLDQEQVLILAEVTILAVFALSALNSTCLKRRNKELTLLRGIGMTNKQMISMIMYEMFYIILICLFLGVLLSIGCIYIASKIFEAQYHYFVFDILFLLFLGCIVLIISCVLISMLYPITSSSKMALSGTFDSQKFQYIQVRYKKLKYQTKWRLALREMKVHKKMTISFFCLLSMLTWLYSVSIVDPLSQDGISIQDKFDSFHYYQTYSENKRVINKLYEQYKDKGYMYQSIYLDLKIKKDNENIEFYDTRNDFNNIINGVYSLLDEKILKESKLQGRMPENDHEVVIGSSFIKYGKTIGDSVKIIDEVKLNDTFEYDHQTYQIVGIIEPNETMKRTDDFGDMYYDLYYAPDSCLYVKDSLYQKWSSKAYSVIYSIRVFDDDQKVKNVMQKDIDYIPWDSDESLQSNNDIDLLMDLDPRLLILPVSLGFIFLYNLHKNQMMNDCQDIALYKLIGMTNRDIMKKQFYKALIMLLMVLVFEIFWIIMFNIYYHIFFIPLKGILLSILILFIINVFVYCYPLRGLLKNNVFELIKGDE